MATTKKRKTAKAEDKRPKFDFEDEKIESVPGLGRILPTVSAVGHKGKSCVKITRGKGDEEFRESITGIVAKSHFMRKFTAGAFDPMNPKPPDCTSLDLVTGTPRSDSGIVNQPGYTGQCDGCPFAFGAGNCQTSRVAYLLRTDVPWEEDPRPVMLNVSRTANKGTDDDVYENAFQGKNEALYVVKVYAKIRINRAGSANNLLAFKLAGDADLATWGPRIQEFRDTMLERVQRFQLMPAAGVTVKELPAGDGDTFD